MEKIKNYSISTGISFGLILLFCFFINLLNYYNFLSSNIYKIILIILVGISTFIGSFLLGKKTNKKGYLEGIKFGILTCIIMFIISFLAFNSSMHTETIIYYLILLITSTIGSTFGINRKKEK